MRSGACYPEQECENPVVRMFAMKSTLTEMPDCRGKDDALEVQVRGIRSLQVDANRSEHAG